MAVKENVKVTTNFYCKYLSVNKRRKKHSMKLVTPITYTLEKRFFATATLEGLCVATFQRE